MLAGGCKPAVQRVQLARGFGHYVQHSSLRHLNLSARLQYIRRGHNVVRDFCGGGVGCCTLKPFSCKVAILTKVSQSNASSLEEYYLNIY